MAQRPAACAAQLSADPLGGTANEVRPVKVNFPPLPRRNACSACLVALHLALLALEVKPGDEVLVPALTYIATGNAVRYMGAVSITVPPR